MRTLTSRCGRGLAPLCSTHPHEPRVWGDIEKVYSCPRCHEEIPLATTAGITRVTRATTTRAPIGGDNKRKRAKLPGSAGNCDDQNEPAQGDNQPKRVKVAANNVANRVVDWVRVIILRTSPSNCSYVLHAHHVPHTYTHNAQTLTHTCVRTRTHNTPGLHVLLLLRSSCSTCTTTAVINFTNTVVASVMAMECRICRSVLTRQTQETELNEPPG
jgi:hypothetical protein